MVDKKSDVFSKPTASSTADAAKKEASRVDAAEAAKPSFARPAPLDVKDDRDVRALAGKTSFSTKHHKYMYADMPGVPSGTWGIAVWSHDEGSQEWPCFLDHHGEWWWATTTDQNGINPAVEKTEAPVGWRTL